MGVPTDPEGLTQVSTPATEGPRRSTKFISQPNTYATFMTGKRYAYAMTQLESQGVFHTYAHMFSQEYFYQDKPNVMISIMTQLSPKSGLN